MVSTSLLWVAGQPEHFFPPALGSVLQDGDGQGVEKLIHEEESKGDWFACLFELVVFPEQFLEPGIPGEAGVLEVVFGDELLLEVVGVLEVEAEEGLVLAELLQDCLLLLLAVVLRNCVNTGLL